jgi:hypothetical protein
MSPDFLTDHFNQGAQLTRAAGGATGVFFTHPGLAITPMHAFGDEIVTAFLIFGIFAITEQYNEMAPQADSGALMIGMLVALIGASMGYLEAWALNPARDLGPRMFCFVAGWGSAAFPSPGNYWWIPIAGPLLGGCVGVSARASEGAERRKQMSALSRRTFLTMAAMASAGWAQPKQTSVVLLLTGVITDGGLSQLAFNGLKSLGPGFRTAYAENIGLAQMQEVARGYSDDGFDLILGHGFEFSSALLDIAPDYPKQKYFVTSFLPQPKIPSNLEFINLGYFGAAYGAGALAALISEKKQAVGFVGGEDDPTQQRIQKCLSRAPATRCLGYGVWESSPGTTTTPPKAGKPRPRWWVTERM